MLTAVSLVLLVMGVVMVTLSFSHMDYMFEASVGAVAFVNGLVNIACGVWLLVTMVLP